MNGFDLGIATLTPLLFKQDKDRRVMLNIVAPVWEGNQVWFLLAAGMIFAAWPLFYSVLFTGLYLPLFGVLAAFIVRPVGFKYRSKCQSAAWRQVWDVLISFGGMVPSLGFGILMGILVAGTAFSFDPDVRLTVGSALTPLTHPLPWISALLWLLLFTGHGAIFARIKSIGTIQQRIGQFLPLNLWSAAVVLLALLIIWHLTIPQMHILAQPESVANPLIKEVLTCRMNTDFFSIEPWMWICLSLFVALTYLVCYCYAQWPRVAFVLSGLRMALVIIMMGAGRFPIILASSTHPAHSLTVWDACSSHLTLKILFISALLFLPLMIYTSVRVYRVLKGPVTQEDIMRDPHTLY